MKHINRDIIGVVILEAVIIIGVCNMLLTGCNYQAIDLNYGFTEAYVIDTGETIKIKSWCDYGDSDMIQFTDTDGRTYLTHSSNVILMK
jgi:hypothetical protein